MKTKKMSYETMLAILQCMAVLLCKILKLFQSVCCQYTQPTTDTVCRPGIHTHKTMILPNKFTFTAHAYENICHMTLLYKYIMLENEFISILVLFTSNLAQVNKRKPGFNQQNLVQRRFCQLTPVSLNRSKPVLVSLMDCRKLLP